MVGQGGGKDQPGIGHQTVAVEGDVDAVGVLQRWHLLGALGAGVGFVLPNHYPRCTGALYYPFSTPRHSSFSVDWDLRCQTSRDYACVLDIEGCALL